MTICQNFPAHLSRRRALGLVLALPALPLKSWGASAVTPSEWLQRWLAAFNDPHDAAYEDFVKAHLPDAVPYLNDDLALREATGGFELLRSEQTQPGEITAWVRDRNWDRFSKVVLSLKAGLLEDIAFAGAPTPAGFAVHRADEVAALDALRQKLQTETRAGRFSGAVLVARGARVLLREAYGTRDAGSVQAATAATRFCIGSMGKMFTAVAILQQAQTGKLRLTDTLVTLLPDYPDTPLARSVTVRHLLTHTGGTGDFFGPDYERQAAQLRTPSDFLRAFGQREVLFAPGSRWGYSNFGFMLLGAILERVCGQPWGLCLQSQVFKPAGMLVTSAVAAAGDTAQPLTGAAQSGLKPLPYYLGQPAGGGYSTVDDLHRFALALQQGQLLDAEHLALLTKPVVPAGSRQWSLGLSIAMRNGASCYGHGGSAPGVNADFAVYPASGYTVVVLCNRGHPHAANVAEFIGSRLPVA